MVNQNSEQITRDKADALLEPPSWAAQNIKNRKLKEPCALIKMATGAVVTRRFNAFLLDFTATPNDRTYSFLKKTVVSHCNKKKAMPNIENNGLITATS